RGRARPLGPALVGCQGEEMADRTALRARQHRSWHSLGSHSAYPNGSEAISRSWMAAFWRSRGRRHRSMKLKDKLHRVALFDSFRAADGDLDRHEPGLAALLRKHRGIPGAGAEPRGHLDRAESAPLAEFEPPHQFVGGDPLRGAGGQGHEPDRAGFGVVGPDLQRSGKGSLLGHRIHLPVGESRGKRLAHDAACTRRIGTWTLHTSTPPAETL